MSTIYSILIGVKFCIFFVYSSVDVRFEIPNQLRQNFPYVLLIQNLDSSIKFPDDNFVLAFELIDSKTDEKIGVAAILKGDNFKGDSYGGFSIETFKTEESRISMKVTFRRKAFENKFLVRYGSAKTDNEKEAFFNDRKVGIVYSKIINLYIPYNISMRAKPDMGVVGSEDRAEIEFNLIPEKYGSITCEILDGLPKVSPQFVNGDILKGNTIKTIRDNLITLNWKVLLEDHGKIIQCRAGDHAVQNITLNVYHYVSKVHSSPQILDKVSRNSQLKCISEGGYPLPKTNWIFVSGPTEPHKFFQFRDNNVTLFINYSAPINSNWSFECRGSNDMPQVVMKYLPYEFPNYPIRTLYNFTVIDTNENVKSSQAGLWIMLIILFTILIAIIVLSYKYRSQICIFLSKNCSQTFKPGKEVEKPSMQTSAPLYKYSEVKKNESQPNGTEDPAYTEIVGIVQSKNPRDQFGPIDRV